MARTQDLQCTCPGEGAGGKSCKRDAFLSPFIALSTFIACSPFIARSPACYTGSSPQEAGGFVEDFADAELIPNFHCLPAKFP